MSPFFQQAVNALGWALLHFVWQGLLIALLLAVLLNFIASAHVRTRYATAYIALITCICLPAKEFLFRMSEKYASKEASASSEIPIQLGLDTTSIWLDFMTWLDVHMNDIVVAWMICVAVLAIRMCMGLLWIAAYTHPKRSKPDPFWQARIDQMSQQFHIRRRVIFRVVEDLDGLVTAGVVRPMIMLPAAMLSGMPVDLLEMLLAHEMAHIKRHNYLLNLIQSVIEMILFYHPAVWWISKQIRNNREEIADDLAARVTGEPRRLALALSELASFQFATPQLAQAAHGGNLMSRIKRLVKPEVSTVNWRAAVAILGIATSCLAVYANANVPVTAVAVVDISQQAMDAAKLAIERDGDKKPIIDFKNCKPEYPRGSIRREESGVVQTSVLVASDGRILKAKVDRSTGFPDLDNAVTTALENCAVKAIPGQVNGENAMLWVKLQYVWKLK
ncbi:M56 family metallopeptidase [Undibacterium sp. Ji42W]|uniref:M56 family metallopeptidase n=1 Tax=Undibacterium sp. Ji42W TaxID=3413039 RepID=UPI003BF0FC64